MQLQGRLLSVVGRRDESRRRGVERECWCDLLGMLCGRRVRRVAGERRSVRSRAAYRNEIALSQQLRAELHVILQIERPAGLELCSERCDGDGLGELLHTPDAAELSVRVLRDGKPGCSPVTSSMVVVVRDRGRSRRWLMVVLVVCRHDGQQDERK